MKIIGFLDYFSGAQQTLRTRACWPIADLKFTCPQTDVSDHPATIQGIRVVNISCLSAILVFWTWVVAT